MTPVIDKEVVDEYMRLRAIKGELEMAKRYYFANIIEVQRQLVEQNPEHLALRQQGFDALISLMGFSPETTVITTLILRPKRLIVGYSEEAKKVADIAFGYLFREGILNPTDLEVVPLNAFDPADIYRKLSDRLPSAPRRVFDITGGTKVMSATAGHLAFEHNLSLCYLNGEWDPSSGSAGLEKVSRLRIILNPSQQSGHEVRRAGLAHFGQGNFVAAGESFEGSRRLIDDNAFDELAVALCRCYSSLADLSRNQLEEDLAKLDSKLQQNRIRSVFENRIQMAEHQAALGKLAQGDQLALTAAYLELLEIYCAQKRHDFACLLAYRAMESLVELGFKEHFPGFEMDKPDYTLLTTTDGTPLKEEYLKLAGPGFSTMPHKVGLVAGFALLCLGRQIHTRFYEFARCEDGLRNAVNMLRGVADRRNRSILAHGSQTLSAADAKDLKECAVQIAGAVLGPEKLAELERLRGDLRPRELQGLRFRTA